MKRKLLPLALLAIALTAKATAASAQTDVAVPGGATGANVFCIQAGDITSGAFVGTFLQTGPGAWEERLKAGAFKLEEKKRDDLNVDLFDSARSASVQFDFVNKTIKYKPSNSKEASGRDRYYILNATDKAASEDCASLADDNAGGGGGGNQAGAGGPSGSGGGGPSGGAGGRGGAGGAGGAPGPGSTPTQMTQVPPKMLVIVTPGTKYTAVQGPPCPGQPGFFLCPNKFACAPAGGVCCGAGACNAGTFCDKFARNTCIGPGNPRFCAGSGDVRTGVALHCPIGKSCVGGNRCQG